jgi:hypothetical protein
MHHVLEAADDRKGPWSRWQSLLVFALVAGFRLMEPKEDNYYSQGNTI